MALGAVDLSSQGEGLGAHFGVPVSPAGDVLSSPQMPVPDNETKAGIFPGKVIIVDHGKLHCTEQSCLLSIERVFQKRDSC